MPKIFFRRQNHSFKKISFLAEFRVSHPCMPDPVTGICRRLAELKVITCCSSRYQVRGRQKAVDRRAGLLMAEYRRKAQNVDRGVIGVGDGVVGPIERKLSEYGDILGLVVGAWGECSEDMHTLVQVLTKSRVDSVGRARGRPATDGELALAVGQVRRRLSVACVRANTNCLLSHLGEAAVQAQGRRQA